MTVSHWVDEGSERCAGIRQAGERGGVEQDLLFRHHGAEQGQDVLDTELVEKKGDTGACVDQTSSSIQNARRYLGNHL